jgi:ferredoxin
MNKVEFAGSVIECAEGTNLRRLLLRHELPLYNAPAGAIHCRGLGTCGTCAVLIEGTLNPPTKVESWRLGFPPHRRDSGLRLACQCQVLSDLKVYKYAGLWGHKTDQPVTQ